MTEAEKKAVADQMADLAMNAQPIFSMREGWVTTGKFRARVNPNRCWYNALWEPKYIPQQRVVKVLGETTFAKWISVGGRYMIEDSDEGFGGEE